MYTDVVFFVLWFCIGNMLVTDVGRETTSTDGRNNGPTTGCVLPSALHAVVRSNKVADL